MNIEKIREAVKVLQEELNYKRVMFDMPRKSMETITSTLKAEGIKFPNDPDVHLSTSSEKEKDVKGAIHFAENPNFNLKETLDSMFITNDIFEFNNFRYTRTLIENDES